MEEKIRNYERKLYMELDKAQDKYGIDNDYSLILGYRWRSVFVLLKELGLEPIR